MDISSLPTYFLAANSGDGFYSEFKSCYNVLDGWKAYIIKGGPGTGKSSMMRSIASYGVQKGIRCEICRCSSDPHSIDAVIFPDIKKVILDGTAPHVVEPKYPAICEQIINTGEYWNDELLKGKEKELLELFKINSACHRRAAQYITAAGQLAKYNFGVQLGYTDVDKTFAAASKLANKYIPRQKDNKKGYEWVRFLSGNTPDGYVFYGDTVGKIANQVINIDDRYGAVASIILSVIRDKAIDAGYEIITLKNELLPNDIIDHIIIPKLSLAFCRYSDTVRVKTDNRHIHSRRFVNASGMSANRQKLAFNRRAQKELLDSAAQCLKNAKDVHDKMEKYYIDIMDFNLLNKYSSDLAKRILG